MKKLASDCLDTAVEEAIRNIVSPRSVMTNITSSLQNTGASKGAVKYLPTQKAIAKRVNRARATLQNASPVPKTWAEMMVPESLQSTASGARFLIMEERVAEGREEKIIGFASPDGIQINRMQSSGLLMELLRLQKILTSFKCSSSLPPPHIMSMFPLLVPPPQ